MSNKNRFPGLALAVMASGLWVSAAGAATVNCPGNTAANQRVFVLDTGPPNAAAQCWDYGAGNIPNKTHGRNQDIFVGSPTPYDGKLHLPTGFSLLDDSADSGPLYEGMLTGSNNLTSGRSGTFSIDGNPSSQYLIIFKTGVAAMNPDWLAFLLPQGVLSGGWSFNGQQSLSHAQIWGNRVALSTPPVPIPAAAWLLGSGLFGLLAFGRRRRAAGAA